MAVEFRDTCYVITVQTGTNPIEDWLALIDELLYVLGLLDVQQNGSEMPWRTLGLISSMMPDWETALLLILIFVTVIVLGYFLL